MLIDPTSPVEDNFVGKFEVAYESKIQCEKALRNKDYDFYFHLPKRNVTAVVDPNFKFSKEDITIFTVLRFKNFENNAVIFDRVCMKSSGEVTYDNSLAVNECKPLISARVNILGYTNLFIQNNDGSLTKSTENTSFQIKKDVSYILTFERIFNQSISLYQNGKLVSSNPENLGEINFSAIKIGRGGTNPDQNVNSDFDLSEFIMVYGKLKNEHKAEIENYLSKKYSIKLER